MEHWRPYSSQEHSTTQSYPTTVSKPSKYEPHSTVTASDVQATSTRAPDCTICYGDQDCLTLEEARCEYYLAADQVLREYEVTGTVGEDQPELRETVDAMVYELVEKTIDMKTDCIPYISAYSDCTKENICVGCQLCSCDAKGAWNCSVEQRCTPSVKPDVNHRVLVSVMENLIANNIDTNRKKLSVSHQPELTRNYSSILKWWHALSHKASTPQIRKLREVHTFEDNTTTSTTTSDPDILVFDDVLRTLDVVESENNTRRKPELVAHGAHNVSYDYIHSNVAINITLLTNSTENFMDLLHALETSEEVTEPPAQGVTKVAVDLLESAKRKALESVHNNIKSYLNDYADFSRVKLNEENYGNNKYLEDLDTINIKKREIPEKSNNTDNPITARSNTTALDLKDSVLTPITNIIKEKQLELDELKQIRNNLLKTIQSYQSGMLDLEVKTNQTSNPTSDIYLSIYNLEVLPQPQLDGRRANIKVIDNHIIKLKRDILEVIRGVALIQKLTPTETIPDNLKYLIRALKYYVRGEKKKGTKPYTQKEVAIQKTRRHFSDTSNPKLIKDSVVEIFQLLDENMPEGNALGHLSSAARKVIKRIIKRNYVNDFQAKRVSVDKNNMTNDLLSIGERWQKMTSDVIKSPIVDRLYAMKLLHLMLSADIVKMMDALKIIDLSRSRRMMAIDPIEGDVIVKNINREIKDVYNKLQLIHPMFEERKLYELDEENSRSNTKKKIKVPFFKRIKKLLKGSKDEIKMLLKKKVPKSEIVEEIAKNKMEELTSRKLKAYEEIMKKWQNNMDIFKRNKRSARDLTIIENRIKNILPKYLRGKLNPAIAANDARKINKISSRST